MAARPALATVRFNGLHISAEERDDEEVSIETQVRLVPDADRAKQVKLVSKRAGDVSFGSHCGLGQKVRLNVAPFFEGEAAAGKFVVCIDGESSMKDLRAKVELGLRKNRVDGRVLHLMNAQLARLPDEEPVGDLLRDGEEVVAMLTRELEELVSARSMEDVAAGPGPATPEPLAPPPQVSEADRATLLALLRRAEGSGELRAALEAAAATGPEEAIPGPSEQPAPGGQEARLSKPGDAELDGLTPKLWEFISTRLSEGSGAVDPSQSSINMSLRAQGSVEPVSYNIARLDVIEFERLCKSKIQEVQVRLEYYQRCREALSAVVERGASVDDCAPNVLPYLYNADEEFCSLLSEADPRNDGIRPLVLVDPSGTVAESWNFVRTALKRMLYSFMVTQKKFNMMKFTRHGRAMVWEPCMVRPSSRKLREAEDWLDCVRPMRNSPDFAGGIRAALASQEADVVYLLTGGIPPRCDADYILGDVRAGNLRGLPIHVIGIDCDARSEMELRRLAEEHHGTFRTKRFATGTASVNPGLPLAVISDPRLAQLQSTGMTIGGQVDILDIMVRESEEQLGSWLEEQKCAFRLLLPAAPTHPLPMPGLDCRPGMQDLVEVAHGTAQHAAAVAQGLVSTCRPLSACAVRQELTLLPQPPLPGPKLRPPVRPRPTSATPGIRRQVLANPWDAPAAAVAPASIRVSQLSARRGAGARQRSLSARRILRPPMVH